MNHRDELKIFRPYEVEGLQRMGNKHDGGYVIHAPSLSSVDCLMTYGVGYDVRFEEDFQAITGKPVYAFDPTLQKAKYLVDDIKKGLYAHSVLQAIKWISWIGKEQKLKKKKIYLIEEGLSGKNDGKFKTLGYHLKKYDLLDKKLFLKIDIEGAEYQMMKDEDFFTHMDNVVQMAYEFHWMDTSLELLINFIKRLERTHTLIHIHANNFGSTFDYHGIQVPHVVEATFLHNSLVGERKLSDKSYPLAGLDARCTTRRDELVTDFF